MASTVGSYPPSGVGPACPITWSLDEPTAPLSEPVTLAEAKLYSRSDNPEEDALFNSLIKAAREWTERATNLTLLTTSWRMRFDRFPYWNIPLARYPVASVTSVNYVDTAGTPQVVSVADYSSELGRAPAIVFPAYGKSWPTARDQQASVWVDFVAGYTSAATVPESLKLWIKLLVEHWYKNRGAILVGTISRQLELMRDALVWPHRVSPFGMEAY